MRDNHDGMPEILDAFERTGQYFGVIAIQREGVTKRFEFGVSQAGYYAMRKILQLCPFDSMPGTKRRYFYGLTYGKILGTTDYEVAVRVEQNRDGKLIDVRMPKDLLSNLVWFSGIKDFHEASHLIQIVN